MEKFLRVLEACEECQGVRRKVVFEMEETECVKMASSALAKKYANLRKKIKAIE